MTTFVVPGGESAAAAEARRKQRFAPRNYSAPSDAAPDRRIAEAMKRLEDRVAGLKHAAPTAKTVTDAQPGPSVATSSPGGAASPLGTEGVAQTVQQLQAGMATLLREWDVNGGAKPGRGEAIVGELKRCIHTVRDEQTRLNTQFDQRHRDLMKEREDANAAFNAERKRVNEAHVAAVENLKQQEASARERRRVARDQAQRDATEEEAEWNAKWQQWQKESADRAEELNKAQRDADNFEGLRQRRNQAFEQQRQQAAKAAEEAERQSKDRQARWQRARQEREEAQAQARKDEKEYWEARDQARHDKYTEEIEELEREEQQARERARAAAEAAEEAQKLEDECDEMRKKAEAARQQAFIHTRNMEFREECARKAMAQERIDRLENPWGRFEQLANEDMIRASDIPVVTKRELYQAYPYQHQRSSVFKKLAKRWHPDKFMQKFGHRVSVDQRDKVTDLVKECFQNVQALCQE